MVEKPRLNLLIMTPEDTLYNGTVASLTCHNPKGTFDVLPEHTNFMSMIDKILIIRHLDGSTKEIPVYDAILQVKENNVAVLINFKQQQSQQTILQGIFGQ